MASRRQFLKTLLSGVGLAALPFSPPASARPVWIGVDLGTWTKPTIDGAVHLTVWRGGGGPGYIEHILREFPDAQVAVINGYAQEVRVNGEEAILIGGLGDRCKGP